MNAEVDRLGGASNEFAAIEGEDAVPELEAKYRNEMRQIVTQKLDLPISTLPSLLKEQIQLNPEFQRRDRWDEKRQSRLIESLVMNVPIPPVFLGEDDYGHYVVLDGRQRLTAIDKFLKNDLKLVGLQVWNELNGKSYQDMVREGLDKYLTRRFVPATVILKESSPVVKYDVFDRLNTGGVTANAMEIRNAVYPGGFTTQLHVWSRDPDFCRLWRIPIQTNDAVNDRFYQEMIDLELVLRFLALCEHEKMQGRFSTYLTEFLQERNRAYGENLEARSPDERRFAYAVRNCWRIFGDNAFIKPEAQSKSIPLADAVMVALSDRNPDELNPQQDAAIRDNVRALFTDNDFVAATSAGTNGKGAITTRIMLAKRAVADALVAG